MFAIKAHSFLVLFVAQSLSLMSKMDGANLNLCRSNSTDYVVTLHSAGEAVCCRERICPPGHYAEPCSPDNPESTSCIPCSPGTFQPRHNLLGTKCINKKSCDDSCTKYKHGGTSTEDAECKCKQGCYWNEDSFSCKKNKLCPPGYGIDDKGGCTECYPGTFSDTYDSLEKCRPHTKCDKFNRCIQIPGNATHDNVCCDLPQADIADSSVIDIAIIQIAIIVLPLYVMSLVGLCILHRDHKTRLPLPGQSPRLTEIGTPIFNDSDCEYQERSSCSDRKINNRDSNCSNVAVSAKTPCSTTGTNNVPLADQNQGPRGSQGREPREEKADDFADITTLPTEDEGKLPVTKIIDESMRCKTDIPMSIPENLKENLLQFKFVDMFGFGKDSFQVYVCSKHFGKHTEPEVKKLIKSLVKAHGMDCDCDVIVSVTPKRFSLMCGKKPSRPGAKIVMKGSDETRFGSLGGYFRTSKGDSRVYVITNEHVAHKGVDVRVIQPCVAGIEDTCTDVHYGTCRWAIETGSTPSRYVDIAAIEVPTLGWRPGTEYGPVESVFNGNIQSVMGQWVFKYGAKTGLTYGKVTGRDFVVKREGDESIYQGLVFVEGVGGSFCAGGDSGSFVRLEHGNVPLAMVVGGNLEDREIANSDHSRISACYPLSKSLMELEKVSRTKWILEDEVHLQCLLPGRYSDRC